MPRIASKNDPDVRGVQVARGGMNLEAERTLFEFKSPFGFFCEISPLSLLLALRWWWVVGAALRTWLVIAPCRALGLQRRRRHELEELTQKSNRRGEVGQRHPSTTH